LPSVIPLDGENVLTGMACPDCAGVIQVRRLGLRGHLEFTCRIGHLYALAELLVAKERDLEHRAWAAVHAAEAMSALLRTLVRGRRAAVSRGRAMVEGLLRRRGRPRPLPGGHGEGLQSGRRGGRGTSEERHGPGGDEFL